ncbi:unnamed protein product [Effrenium voratum]|uniref:Fungal lipase-type domain-containing protein n=1 Tax=Effrenium voratum TaxID=2562239 RepID=A0AA36N2X0_9DINO|nr:unnamed protein product [Effrenium voratum]
MPFFPTERFRRWEDDGTGTLWKRFPESEGVFLGRRYVAGALRFLRPVRGASSAGYAIIIADGNGGYVQVADAHEETDFCEMLQKLNSTACDVMAVAMTCADQMQLLHRVIEKAKQVPQPSAAMAHELSEIEKLERTLKQRDRELAESQRKLRQREAELRDAKEQLLLLQGRLSRRQEAEEEFVAGAAVEALMTADPVGSKRSGPFGVPSRPSLGPCQPPEANLKDLLEVDGDLSEVLLRGRVFRESPAMGFWQLAKASYNHHSSGHVEEDGKLWLVVAEVQRTNTRVIARESSPGAVELGFRGTVSEDSGGASQANWASNLDSELVSLDPRFHRSKVGSPPKVHKGFQEAYGAVASQVVAWLRGVGRGRDVRRVRLAGHSLGGALATLAAVHLAEEFNVEVVVTFGSPRVGAEDDFRELYARLGLARRTARFCNAGDPVCRVPLERWGFVHVVQEKALGRALPLLGLHPDSHSMEGSKSYFRTLRDAIEGPALCSKTMSAACAVSTVVEVAVAARNTPATLEGGLRLAGELLIKPLISEKIAMAADVCRMRQEMKVDIAQVRADCSALVEGMNRAERRLHEAIRETQHWTWLVSSVSVAETIDRHMIDLPPWSRAGSGSAWFLMLTERRDQMLKAAEAEQADPGSQLASHFLKLFLRMGELVVLAMRQTGASDKAVEREAGAFRSKCQGFLHADCVVTWAEVVASLQSLGSSGHMWHGLPLAHWSAAAKNVLEDPSSLQLDFKEVLEDSWFKDLLSSSLFQYPWTTLRLNIAKQNFLTDASLEALADKLPPSLTALHLLFRSNISFTDVGLQRLASKLPSLTLQSLRLDFHSNQQFTNKGLLDLAKSLPEDLKALHLNFHHNTNFTDEGLQKLTSKARSLVSMHLGFHSNQRFTDVGLQGLASQLPPSLAELYLDFGSNENFTDAGLRGPGDTSHLDFYYSMDYGAGSPRGLADCLPPKLTNLHLDFGCNANFSPARREFLRLVDVAQSLQSGRQNESQHRATARRRSLARDPGPRRSQLRGDAGALKGWPAHPPQPGGQAVFSCQVEYLAWIQNPGPKSRKTALEQGEEMLAEQDALDERERLVRLVKSKSTPPDPFRSHIAGNIKQRLVESAHHDSKEGLAINQRCLNIRKQLAGMINARKELASLRAKVHLMVEDQFLPRHWDGYPEQMQLDYF